MSADRQTDTQEWEEGVPAADRGFLQVAGLWNELTSFTFF